jgi:hypothetical protein
MSIAPFRSDKQLLKFAERFFRNRLETFRKDIDICMTPNSRGEHAYFPALFIFIAFADLLSGLHAGKVWPRPEDFKRYAAKFIRHPEYTPDHVNMLRECLSATRSRTWRIHMRSLIRRPRKNSRANRGISSLGQSTLAIGVPQSNSSSTRARVSLPEIDRRGVFRTMLGSKFECADFTWTSSNQSVGLADI